MRTLGDLAQSQVNVDAAPGHADVNALRLRAAPHQSLQLLHQVGLGLNTLLFINLIVTTIQFALMCTQPI